MIACPSCRAEVSSVLDTRSARGYIRRRRECECGARYTTHERLVESRPASQRISPLMAEDVGARIAAFARHPDRS